MFRPSYADDGSFDDLPTSSPLLSEPPHRLRLERTHGYHGGGFYPSTDTNTYFLGENHMPRGGVGGGIGSGGDRRGHEEDRAFFEVVYPTAALVVMHKFRVRERVEGEPEKGNGGGVVEQRFFDGHTDDVTAVAVHPGGVLVASGQVRGRQALEVFREEKYEAEVRTKFPVTVVTWFCLVLLRLGVGSCLQCRMSTGKKVCGRFGGDPVMSPRAVWDFVIFSGLIYFRTLGAVRSSTTLMSNQRVHVGTVFQGSLASAISYQLHVREVPRVERSPCMR